MSAEPFRSSVGASPPVESHEAGRGALAVVRALGRALLAPPRAVSAAFPVAWAALVWWASEQSDGVSSGWPLPPWLAAWLHDLAHPFVFGLLALLLVPLLPRTAQGPAHEPARGPGPWVAWSRARGAAVFAAVVAYGFVDELHQAHVPGRTASFLDLFSDAMGAGSVLAVIAYVSRPDARRAGLWTRLGLALVLCCAAAAASTAHAWHFGGGLWPSSWGGSGSR
jgi:hypothetical protein